MASFLTNMLGAGLTFVYFAFIRSGLTPDRAQPDLRTQTWYFALVMIVVCSAALVFALRYYGPLWRDLSAVKDEPDPKRVKAVVTSLLNLPFIPIRHKKYNVADSCHCEGVKPEAISQ